MTRLEKAELSIIGSTIVAVYLLSLLFPTLLPTNVSLGLSVVWLALMMFLQSLARDLTILSKQKGKDLESVEKQCFCLESLVGVGVLLIGFLLLFIGNTTIIDLSNTVITIAVFAVLLIGFLIKDLVLTWNPIGIRREPDHMNIIVKW